MIKQILIILLVILCALILVTAVNNIKQGAYDLHVLQQKVFENAKLDELPIVSKFIGRYVRENQKYYVPPTSNKQILQIIKYGGEQYYYALCAKIARELGWTHDIPNKVHGMLKHYTDDKAIYDEILKARSFSYSAVAEKARGAKHAELLFDIIKQWNHEFKPTKILDIGCGSGAMVSSLGERFGLSDADTIGADIDNWGEYSVDARKEFRFTYKLIEPTGPLPMKDGEFDLIICNMCLHHIKQLDERIAEIARCLSKRGIIVIREHDAQNAFDKILIDVEHLLYVYGSNGSVKDYYGEYLSRQEISELFKEQSIKIVKYGSTFNTYALPIDMNKAYWAILTY